MSEQGMQINIRKLIIPLIFEQLLAVSVGMVDTLMVSTAGEVAVSGVALVDNLNRLVIQVMAAFCTGGIVVGSQYFGRKDTKRAKITCAQLEFIVAVFCLTVMLIFIIFTRAILSVVFGSIEDAVMDAACTYMVVTSISYPFLGLYNVGAAIYRSIGNSRISMEISIVMNIVNVAFNAIFVFGFGMGVLGVGLATLISRVVAGLIMTGRVLAKSNPLQLCDISLFAPQRQYIRNILRIGIPSGIENGMFQIGKLVVVSIVATFGTQAIAANSIGYQIMDFPNIPGQSVGLALVTIMGQCMGAGNVKEAKRYTVKMMKLAYLSDWFCKITLAICAPWVVGWFSLTEGTATLAVFLLRCFCMASLPAWPMSFVMPNALRAAGDVKYTMTVSIASMWICRIGCSYLLGVVMGMGVLGVWCGMFVDWYARSICYLGRYISGKWSYKKVV